jgi:hypothetical protein
MTVAVQTPFNSYTANGVTTVFAFAFAVLQSSDLVVQTVDSAGNATTKTLGADYTVSGVGAGSGGTVTFLSAPANGLTVKVFRSSLLARSTDYQNNGDLLAAILNVDLDRVWLALQEILGGNQVAPNAIHAQPGESLDVLAPAASRKDHLLGFNISTGQPEMSSFTMTQVASVVAAIYAAAAGPLDALSFLQGGTGARSRTAQNKAREIVSLEDFGARQHADRRHWQRWRRRPDSLARHRHRRDGRSVPGHDVYAQRRICCGHQHDDLFVGHRTGSR